MVCVTAESRVSPSLIQARHGRLSVAAQVLEVLVGNAPFLQASGQVPLRGPRDSLRDRVVADVREELDSVLQKEGDERIEGSSGVTDCPDGGPGFLEQSGLRRRALHPSELSDRTGPGP